VAEALTLQTSDGLALEAERAAPPPGVARRAAAVLCHPHPQFGGSMRAVVVSPLFEQLPHHGIECLRFNFRGVEGSEGSFGQGIGERLDAAAAIAAQHAHAPDLALVCIGFSFGADVALSMTDGAIAAWVAIAPPLHFAADGGAAVGRDPRPKLVVLAQHDTFRAADEVAALAASWVDARVEIVGGASHFFVGRADRVVELVAGFAAGF
jgi:uncharacterized protein